MGPRAPGSREAGDETLSWRGRWVQETGPPVLWQSWNLGRRGCHCRTLTLRRLPGGVPPLTPAVLAKPGGPQRSPKWFHSSPPLCF